ncbi:MAG TPA: hypothetical protein VHV10_00860, partial [Ktedonobacteraceae bacterium]|nr:hypothetical protein [Ktedonobacteraceae bacterium]
VRPDSCRVEVRVLVYGTWLSVRVLEWLRVIVLVLLMKRVAVSFSSEVVCGETKAEAEISEDAGCCP